MPKKPVHLGRSSDNHFMFLEPGIEGNFFAGQKTFSVTIEEFVKYGLVSQGCEDDARFFGKSDGWRFVVPSEFL